MKKHIKTIVGSFVGIALLGIGLTASANSSFFLPSATTATATSSTAIITPGAGTTTLSYDSYANGTPRATDKAYLLMQFSASSTAAILQWRYEFSQNNVDWYGDTLNVVATSTTGANIVNGYTSYQWNYASSTIGTSVSATAFKIVSVPTPTRYVRAVFYVPASGGTAGLWAQFLPVREAIQ